MLNGLIIALTSILSVSETILRCGKPIPEFTLIPVLLHQTGIRDQRAFIVSTGKLCASQQLVIFNIFTDWRRSARKHLRRFFWLAQKEEFLALPLTTVALAAWGGLLYATRTSRAPLSSGGRYWLWNGALAVLLSAVMRGHQGGYMNVLMPALWALSVGGVVAIERIRTRFPHRAVVWALPLLVGGQLIYEDWNPERYRTDEQDLQAGEKVVEAVAALEGEVLAPWSPWIAVQAGKKPYFHLIGLWDIDHKHGVLVDAVADIRADVENHRWDHILVMDERMMPAGVKKFYRRREPVVVGGPVLKPKTGWRVKPRNFWRPKVVEPEQPL